jgi:hypothetical protein
MPQFESSHSFAYIFVWGAVYNIQKKKQMLMKATNVETFSGNLEEIQ